MNKPPDDPRWCPMLEAIKLRTEQLGDRDMAILDLERAIESGKLRGVRWSYASGESRLTAPFRELFPWVNGYAYDDWLENVPLYDDPEGCADKIARLSEAGVRRLILWMGPGGVPHELLIRSMRLFAERVMPRFR